jgi:hypothetical protein
MRVAKRGDVIKKNRQLTGSKRAGVWGGKMVFAAVLEQDEKSHHRTSGVLPGDLRAVGNAAFDFGGDV